MKDYTKFRSVPTNNKKSRSMDFQSHHDQDLFSPPPPHQEKPSPHPISTPKPTPISPTPISTTPTPTTPSNNNNTTTTTTTTATTTTTTTNEQVVVEDGVGEEKFGVILTRDCSVSSTPASSLKFRAENQKQNKALQAAVVRAFSMRRSASVTEGYSRIHDQSDDPFGSPANNGDGNKQQGGMASCSKSSRKNKKGRRILRACRSFFGL